MQNIPLAERIRPRKLSEVIGQKHLIGDKGTLKIAINKKLIPSMILWGPPGVGKTTLSCLIAQELDRPFYTISAINSGVKDVREVIHKASSLGLFGKDIPILFIDEIHRFSKAQQDSLLGAVEKGVITLIGATTENPSFEVISALLSRSQVYVLESLSKDDLQKLLERAKIEDEILSKLNITLKETESLMQISGGDARKLLNIFELVVSSVDSSEIIITNDLVVEKAQQNIVRYDKNGELHYDIISAFIKSALNTAYEGYFPKYKGGTRYAAFAYKTSPILKEGHSALRKEWQCSICDRKPTILPRVHSLFCHKYIEGKNINTHLCLDCNYKTESIEMMKIHLRAHRGGDTGLHEFGTNNSFMQGMPGM